MAINAALARLHLVSTDASVAAHFVCNSHAETHSTTLQVTASRAEAHLELCCLYAAFMLIAGPVPQ